ncbi:MAG: DUF4339 domain-containing protein [Planctomycetota bacterium]|nr:DUF4339 domain-containing protein [Planctomycetota bacterium]
MSDEGEWHYKKAGKIFGPVPTVQLREFVAAHKIKSKDLVRPVGGEDWVPAGEIANLFNEDLLKEEAERAERMKGPWRSGKDLIVHSSSRLPQRCVLTNSPEIDTFVAVRMDGSRLMTLIMAALVSVWFAMLEDKGAILHVPLSVEGKKVRLRRTMAGVGIVLAGIGVGVLGLALKVLPVIVIGIALSVVGVLWAGAQHNILWTVKKGEQVYWLRGCCPEFLDGLPEYRKR